MRQSREIVKRIGRTGGILSTANDVPRGHIGLCAEVPYMGQVLRVIASNACGWDHVSVSHGTRCPTWGEMCYVKDLFWHDEEAVMQLHPAKRDYINCHPFVLHLWKPQGAPIPMPPKIMV